MDLAPEDIAFIDLWLHNETQPIFASLKDCFEKTSRYIRQPLSNIAHPILPCILGIPAGAFSARFAADAPLVKSGLVSVDNAGDIEIVRRLLRLDFAPDASDLDVCSLLLDAATPGELEWSDFDHVAEERDHIEKMVQGALSTGKPGVNILVYGPPGTGKTEFCKTLAARLGKSLYSVGEEDGSGDDPRRDERLQNLRLAQRLLAPGRGSILLFDETEDLLSNPDSGWLPFSSRSFPHLRLADRQGAVRSWEVSQVNEMLTWMESHPLPFACTTNFGDNLDPATLRRFTFKIVLDYLTPAQSQAAFRTYFALKPPPEVAGLTILTPGDFAVVRRKAEILGHPQDAKALVELLRAECEAKPNHARKMGF